MAATGLRSTQPFADLKRLLGDVRELVEAGLAPGSPGRVKAESVFVALEAWVVSALQRKRRSDSVIDAALDAVVAINSAGEIVAWNAEAERMFGWKASDALGKPVSELLIPLRYRAAHTKGLARFLKTGTGPMVNRRTELTAVKRSGAEFPVELTVLTPLEVDGTVVVYAFLRDISDRHTAEEAVRGSEALYHSLVDSLPIHVIRKDLQGRLTFANRTYCELIGRTLEELRGLTDYDLFPAQLAEKYVRDDQHVAESGEIFHDIEKNVADGRARYFEVYKVPVTGGDGKVAETQAIFWDVTERVETREALARERDLLRTLMDSLPDLVYVKDRDSRFVTGNQAQLRLVGVEAPEDFEGTTAFDFYPRELAEAYAAEDRAVMETGEPMLDREEYSVDAHGLPNWYLSSKVPFRDRDGTILGIVGIDRDITKRKLAEQELLRSNRELDQFVSVVTHDLQAPLRVVASYGKLLQESVAGKLDDDGREYLREMQGALARMQRLIDSLRSYARITGKKRPRTPIDLNLVVEQAISNLELEIRDRQATVTHDPLPTLPGDSVQLMQLFQNLIANGIKYCRGRLPEVHISASEQEAEWHLTVADNGIGIDPDRIPDLFRIFHRLHDDESEFTGTGIGLSVCKRIVERHRGRIWVESMPGSGTKFHFTLSKDATDKDPGA